MGSSFDSVGGVDLAAGEPRAFLLHPARLDAVGAEAPPGAERVDAERDRQAGDRVQGRAVPAREEPLQEQQPGHQQQVDRRELEEAELDADTLARGLLQQVVVVHEGRLLGLGQAAVRAGWPKLADVTGTKLAALRMTS